MTRHLRFEQLALFLALAIGPILVITGVISIQSNRRERQNALDLQREISARAATLLSTYIENADSELHLTIQTADFKEAERPRQEQVLAQALFYKNIFDELALLDSSGQERARVSRLGAVPAAELRSRAQEPAFRQTLQTNKTYYGDVSFSSISQEPRLEIAIPTLDSRTGQPDGVLVGAVRLGQVFDRVVNITFGEAGSIAVVSAGGRVVAHRDSQVVTQATTFDLSKESGITSGITGARVLLTSEPLGLGGTALYFVGERPIAEIQAQAIQIGIIMTVLLLVTVICVVVAGLIAVNRIAEPVQTLAVAAQAISAGDLSRTVAVTRRNEIGMLQQAFNQMVGNLREQREAIEQRNHELRESMAAQQQLLQTVTDLSTPLLPVWEGVVVLPIVGHVDAQRGQEILNGLVQGVAQQRARVAILDITGIAVLDTAVLAVLTQAMRAVELLGARAILAGISPEAARLIVAQKMDLSSFVACRDLRTAVETALMKLS